jgi:tRNA-dihydrouridine synthase A
MTRHLLGLFAGRPGARAYRRRLAMLAPRRSAGIEVLSDALAELAPALDAAPREPVAAFAS